MKKKKATMKRIQFYVSSQEYEAWEKAAKRADSELSDFVRHTMRDVIGHLEW